MTQRLLVAPCSSRSRWPRSRRRRAVTCRGGAASDLGGRLDGHGPDTGIQEYQGRAAGTEGWRQGARVRPRSLHGARTVADGAVVRAFVHASRRRLRPLSGAAASPSQGVNVVGRCAGTDPALPAIVLSAHYDHLGIRDGRIYPGADDNASGVAALLEMAAQCMAQPFRHDSCSPHSTPKRAACMVRAAFVLGPPLPRDRLALDVNLDMVARGDKGEIYIAGTRHTPEAALAARARGGAGADQGAVRPRSARLRP